MKGVKLRMIFIILIILLSQTNGVYCFFEDGTNLEPAVQEMLAQRESLEKKYIAYQKQKALEKEKVQERLSLARIRLEEIQDTQSRKSINAQTNISIMSNNENLKKTAVVKSYKILQIMFLVLGLIGCMYWIYRINKKKS